MVSIDNAARRFTRTARMAASVRGSNRSPLAVAYASIAQLGDKYP